MGQPSIPTVSNTWLEASGSAAALYYDDIDITIGGDGGSIRIPASWCVWLG